LGAALARLVGLVVATAYAAPESAAAVAILLFPARKRGPLGRREALGNGLNDIEATQAHFLLRIEQALLRCRVPCGIERLDE
jgi:hypothetical protein